MNAPFASWIQVLRPQTDLVPAIDFLDGFQIHKRREKGDIDLRKLRRSLRHGLGQCDRAGAVQIHFPIPGNEFLSHGSSSKMNESRAVDAEYAVESSR